MGTRDLTGQGEGTSIDLSSVAGGNGLFDGTIVTIGWIELGLEVDQTPAGWNLVKDSWASLPGIQSIGAAWKFFPGAVTDPTFANSGSPHYVWASYTGCFPMVIARGYAAVAAQDLPGLYLATDLESGVDAWVGIGGDTANRLISTPSGCTSQEFMGSAPCLHLVDHVTQSDGDMPNTPVVTASAGSAGFGASIAIFGAGAKVIPFSSYVSSASSDTDTIECYPNSNTALETLLDAIGTRYLTVACQNVFDGSAKKPSGVTYGGQSMTFLYEAQDGGDERGIYVYGLDEAGIAAATTTTISVSGWTSDAQRGMFAICFMNVEQGGPIQAGTEYDDSSPADPLTGHDLPAQPEDGSMVLSVFGCKTVLATEGTYVVAGDADRELADIKTEGRWGVLAAGAHCRSTYGSTPALRATHTSSPAAAWAVSLELALFVPPSGGGWGVPV